MPHFFRHAAPVLCLLAGIGTLAPLRSVHAQGAVSDADLALFRKSVSALAQVRTLESDSDMRVNAIGAGASVTYRERIRITAQRPNKFHSEITLLRPNGGVGARYVVVSDGSRVWTYRPGLGQYSVASRAEFENRDNDFPALGLYAGALFLSDASAVTAFTGTASQDSAQTQTALRSMGMTLTSQTTKLDNADYQVFKLNMGKGGFTYTFFVHPQSAALTLVEMKTRQEPLEMQVMERVNRSSTLSLPSDSLFRFTPPPGARKVAQIAIQPF